MMGSGGLVVMDEATCMVDIGKILPELHSLKAAASAMPQEQTDLESLTHWKAKAKRELLENRTNQNDSAVQS